MHSNLLLLLALLYLSQTIHAIPTVRQTTPQTVLHPALQLLGATWPVPTAPRSNISSTFGPRVYRATPRYDFHRGIDISAGTGTLVVATLPGTLYGTRVYSGGGNTVIIDHAVNIRFHGQSRTRASSFYMHLDDFATEIKDAKRGDAVEAGTVIGYVGKTGQAVSPHLHFELRVGVRCSLEYQLNNPTAGCASFQHDPHVHPLGLFQTPSQVDELDVTVSQMVTATEVGIVEVCSPDEFPVANRYEVIIVRDVGLERLAVMDLNTREGFDASSTSAIDDPVPVDGMPFIVPRSFGQSATRWCVEYHVPAAFGGKAAGEQLHVVVTDVFEKKFTVEIADRNENW